MFVKLRILKFLHFFRLKMSILAKEIICRWQIFEYFTNFASIPKLLLGIFMQLSFSTEKRPTNDLEIKYQYFV